MNTRFIFYLLPFFSLLCCTPSEDNNEIILLPEEEKVDFREYLVEPCTNFVDFGNQDDFLLFLRSKGYDNNNDGKISCVEAKNIVNLHFEHSGVRYLDGIEYLVNLSQYQVHYPMHN